MIDSTLWVDYFRAQTPEAVKEQIIPWVDDPDAVLCEPVRFEILRAVSRPERRRIEEIFATVPLVSTPPDLWPQSVLLGQQCVEAGLQVPAFDLLIAHICLCHDLSIVSFDRHFAGIAKVCPLRVRLLDRAA